MAKQPLTPRDKYLRRVYGITQAEYDALFEYQRGVCFICEKPPKEGKNLQVDHDHKSGLVRGLLCWFCNKKRVGRETDPNLFHQAWRYLIDPPARHVIGEHKVPPKKRKRRRKK